MKIGSIISTSSPLCSRSRSTRSISSSVKVACPESVQYLRYYRISTSWRQLTVRPSLCATKTKWSSARQTLQLKKDRNYPKLRVRWPSVPARLRREALLASAKISRLSIWSSATSSLTSPARVKIARRHSVASKDYCKQSRVETKICAIWRIILKVR